MKWESRSDQLCTAPPDRIGAWAWALSTATKPEVPTRRSEA